MARDPGELNSAPAAAARVEGFCKRSAYRLGSAIALLAAVVATLFLAIPSTSHRTPLPGSHIDDPALALAVLEVLSPPLDGPTPDPGTLKARLLALGDAALPLEIAILCGEFDMPEFVPGSADRPVHPIAIASRDDVLLGVLQSAPAASVLQCLRRYPDANTPVDVRLVLARLLGELDADGALEALLDLANGIEAIQFKRAYVVNRLEAALGRRIERTTHVGARLQSAFSKTDPALWPALARAAGRSRSPEVASFLVFVLGRTPELDAVAMQTLSGLVERIGARIPDEQLSEIRRMLEHSDPRVRRTASMVLGRLRDRAAASQLIDALASDDPLVVAAARGALHELAGTDLGADARAWEGWLASEEHWWEIAEETLSAQLVSADAGQVFDAMRAFLDHPAFAREAGVRIAELVLAPEAPIASAAIDALRRIGAPFALAGLVAALDRTDEEREHAAVALRELTGLRHPSEPGPWREALALARD